MSHITSRVILVDRQSPPEFRSRIKNDIAATYALLAILGAVVAMGWLIYELRTL